VLATHPAVNSVAVIPMPDPKWGEVGHAIIVISTAIVPTADEIYAYCQDKLARFKIPKRISFVEQLPISATGKINRKQLLEDYE
ncbi:MAG: long-chain fatty acid--CoA ligase, partial [Saprospiraceae bacterium]